MERSNGTKVGDRIVLYRMPDDPNPIETGATGTVTSVSEIQVGVKWDNGRTLYLVPGTDRWGPEPERVPEKTFGKHVSTPKDLDGYMAWIAGDGCPCERCETDWDRG